MRCWVGGCGEDVCHISAEAQTRTDKREGAIRKGTNIPRDLDLLIQVLIQEVTPATPEHLHCCQLV